MYRFTVGLANLLPARDGEVTFRAAGQFLIAQPLKLNGVAITEFGKQLLEDRDLFGNRLRPSVAREVAA